MVEKRLLCPNRRRRTPAQFSWLDHRLMRERRLESCPVEAWALYLFLVTVGDAQGLSYYSDASLSGLDDVTLNRMHVREDIIARTGGGGLVLDDSTARLHLRADVPEYRADVRDQVARRILRGLSVEMRVTAEDWPAPTQRIIRAAELRAIAVVDRAAYGDTTVALAKRAQDGGVEVRWWPLVV